MSTEHIFFCVCVAFNSRVSSYDRDRVYSLVLTRKSIPADRASFITVADYCIPSPFSNPWHQSLRHIALEVWQDLSLPVVSYSFAPQGHDISDLWLWSKEYQRDLMPRLSPFHTVYMVSRCLTHAWSSVNDFGRWHQHSWRKLWKPFLHTCLEVPQNSISDIG